MSADGQFSLLKTRRFAPFFVTQFLGAFNDNLYKNALVVLLTFQATRYTTLSPGILVNLCAGLFILPFFLFSATAGQIADKYEKSRLIRLTKLLEIAIALLACVAFAQDSLTLMLAALFLLGAQSALFGPVKYAILPQHLHESELIGGNALVESGTFVAILIGTLAGGLAIALPAGESWISAATVLVALAGYATSRSIPTAPAASPGLRINWNPLSETWRNLQHIRDNRTVFLSILGNSWFWFYGALFLSQFPAFAKDVLGGNEQAVTLLLAVFSVGIGVGSLLCERLSAGKVEIGLVPFGSIGMTLFALDLWWASPALAPVAGLPLGEILSHAPSWRALFDLLAIGMFGGFYIVPLYALIQTRSDVEQRSRIIAGNNILNALFMVVAAGLGAGLLAAGLSVPQLFLVTALLNAAVALYIYTLVPEFLLRFIVWLLVHTIYQLKSEGLQHIPEQGAALLVGNHVSVIDPLVVATASRRPLRFVLPAALFGMPVVGFMLRQADAIPYALQPDGQLDAPARQAIAAALAAGDALLLFPEGRPTPDGELGEFLPAFDALINDAAAPVLPFALGGLWGSSFSAAARGRRLHAAWQRVFSRIELRIGPPQPATSRTPAAVRAAIIALRGPTR